MSKAVTPNRNQAAKFAHVCCLCVQCTRATALLVTLAPFHFATASVNAIDVFVDSSSSWTTVDDKHRMSCTMLAENLREYIHFAGLETTVLIVIFRV